MRSSQIAKRVSLPTFNTPPPVLHQIEYELKNKNFNVKRAPFGWYKSFKISCKGHPLSELSREIIPDIAANKGPHIGIPPSQPLNNMLGRFPNFIPTIPNNQERSKRKKLPNYIGRY
jgi:hypothetical protein